MTPITFGWRHGWVVKAAVGSTMGAIMTTAFAIAIATKGFGDFALDRRVIVAGVFAAFALLLGGAAITYGAAIRRPEWVVRLDAAGVHDRRLSADPIPWTAIRAMLPLRHGMQLMLVLDVADPKAIALPRHALWWVNRRSSRLLGDPELSVRLTGLDADMFVVMQAIEEQAVAATRAPDAPPPDPSAS